MANINFCGENGVDFSGIKGLLCFDCITCNLYLKFLTDCICSKCPFSSNSTMKDKTTKKNRIRIYPGKEFKKYGLINLPAMGKHTLFYFLYNEELNFKWPEIPQVDLLENLNKQYYPLEDNNKKFIWHLHHENGNYWDDSCWNLFLCLNTEHGFFESEHRKFERIAQTAIWR